MTNRPDPRIVVHSSKTVLADAAAARLVTAVVDAQAERGEAQIVLTGGSMGSAILASLGRTPGAAAIDWQRVSIWWGDERFLPKGDPDRNETQAREALLDRLPLDPARVHPMPHDGEGLDVEEAAEAYVRELAEATGWTAPGPTFDVVMLGVGPDCHVASLFPHRDEVEITGTCAVGVRDSPKPPALRVSQTCESLSRSRDVWFLVAGRDKAEAVSLAHSPGPVTSAPARGVTGAVETLWLIDEDAASLLPGREDPGPAH